MFHPGDLQSGISRALAESKLVACFVTGGFNDKMIHGAHTNLWRLDHSEQSVLWEEDFLRDEEVPISGGVPAL